MSIRYKDAQVEVFDAHTHLGRRPIAFGAHAHLELLGAEKIAQMDKAGVDQAVVFPMGMFNGDYREANSLIASEVAASDGRLVGYCRANPNLGPDASAAEMERCLGGLGLRGVKLHPAIEFFDPSNRTVMEPIYEAAKQYRVPLIFHTGMSDRASPTAIADVAAHYPDVPVILGHMGVAEQSREALIVAARHDNIFLETSVIGWIPNIVAAFRRLGTSKLMYGSDHPANPFSHEIFKMATTVAGVLDLSEEDVADVMSRNIAGLLAMSERPAQ